MKTAGIVREVASAGVVACVSLPFCMGFGAVAYAPLGPASAAAGALAGLTGGIVGGAFAALLGGTVSQVSAPTIAGALVLAHLFAGLLSDPALGTSAVDRVPAALALGAVTVGLAGVLQLVLGLLRVGNAVKYVAYPVVTGLTSAIAILTILGQLPAFAAAASWSQLRTVGPGTAAVATAVTGLITLLAMTGRIVPAERVPPALTAIVLGTLTSQVIGRGFGPLSAPPAVGAVPTRLIPSLSVSAFSGLTWSPGLTASLLGAAASIALLASLNTLLASVAVDGLSGERHDGNRELVGQGLANVAAGLAGGLSVGGLASLGLLNYRTGGRTRLSGVAHSLWLLLFVAGLGPAVALLPKVGLASVIVVSCWRMLDPWVLRLCRSVLRPAEPEDRALAASNLALVLGVAVIALSVNLVAAIAVGIAASTAVFVVDASRVRFRLVFRGTDVHSKLARPLEEMAVLAREGDAIVGIELEGSIFFGSAEPLVDAIERVSAGSAYVLLGLRRVDRIDATGFRVLRQFMGAAIRRGRSVVLANLPPEGQARRFLVQMGSGEEIDQTLFRDMDAALEWAESALLARHVARASEAELPLGALRVLQGIAGPDLTWLAARLTRREHSGGATIVRQGEVDRTLFLLARGLVEVVSSGHRIATFAAGTIVGELALLDGGARSASVVAVEETVTYSLDGATLEEARRERPALVATLLLNLSVELSLRLRAASQQIRALQA